MDMKHAGVRFWLGVFVLLFAVQGVRAQMLPSHGASAAGQEPVLVTRRAPAHTGYYFTNDVGLSLVYGPSPKERGFDEVLGFSLHATFPMQASVGLRASAGYEKYGAKRPGDDANVMPLGLSVVLGLPGEAMVPVALELGLRYNIVDFEDVVGDYDNGFGGVAGLYFEPALQDMLSFSAGLRYTFDISKSENDMGDSFSLEGLAILLGLRLTF